MISTVACALQGRGAHAPKLSGDIPDIRIRPGSYLHSFYQSDLVSEEFFCNYEVNPDFEGAILEAGFSVSARGAAGEIRAIESPGHRFFIATLFQPQLKSRAGRPHPIITEFMRAAARWKDQKVEDSVLE